MNEGYLSHKGTKGSKWGYTKGKRNGKRTAQTRILEDNGKKYYKVDGKDSTYGKYETIDGKSTYSYRKGESLTRERKIRFGDKNGSSDTYYRESYASRAGLSNIKPKIKTVSVTSKEYTKYVNRGMTQVNKILGKFTKKATKSFNKKKKK